MSKPIDPEWKKKVKNALLETGLVDPDFTGKLELNLVSGGIGSVKREEIYK